MEAEDFDDIIKKKLQSVNVPDYDAEKWKSFQTRIDNKTSIDSKTLLIAASVLLNLLLAGWLLNGWQNEKPEQNITLTKHIVLYDTITHRTVVYDTIYKSIHVKSTYQYIPSNLPITDDGNTNWLNQVNKNYNHPKPILYNTEPNQYTENQKSNDLANTRINQIDSSLSQQDSVMVVAENQPQDSALHKTEEAKRFERKYHDKKEMFLTSSYTLPVINTGPASKVSSNVWSLGFEYMFTKRIGAVVRATRYAANYNAVDQSFHIPEGGYNPSNYQYTESNVNAKAYAYHLGLRAIAVTTPVGLLGVELGYGNYFSYHIDITNRLTELSTGKTVYTELPSETTKREYVSAGLNLQHDIGYKLRLRTGIEFRGNLNNKSFLQDNHIKNWTGINLGLVYQLK